MTKTIPIQRRAELGSWRVIPSRLVLGCMGLGGGWNQNPITREDVQHAEAAIDAALSIGIHMFDHADIYTLGKAETVFGTVLKARPSLRDDIIIQSKCGIRFRESDNVPGRYDFSERHILSSVDGILRRLQIEYVDVLLLHRPDPLAEPDEVAGAIQKLRSAGKVRAFGVSNMSQAQIQWLQHACDEPFIVNQLEMSLHKHAFVNSVVHVNQAASAQDGFPEGTVEYCHLNGIQIQAWGSLAKGLFSGASLEGQSEAIQRTATRVAELAAEKSTTKESIVLAWLMKHPAGIQPVIGTANPARILACAQSEQTVLTREEWYDLYVRARGIDLP